MNIIFAGTPEFAAAHLQALVDNGQHQVVAVYTQPDRPAGRGKKLTPSAVKQLACAQQLPVFQPASLKDQQQQDLLDSHKADIMLVVAYGLILPQAVLDIPRLGCINVHGSILPRWRGAAPIQRAIEAGDSETGISIMQMDAGLDTGPVISVARCEIADHETSGSLYQKLADMGAPTLLSALGKIEAGTAVAEQQEDNLSTYARKINKSEARLDWSESAATLARRIRAFNPFPAAYSLIEGSRVKVWTASLADCSESGVAGTIIESSGDGLLVQCGSGRLLITEIQLAGKSRMPVSEILKSRAELFARGKRFGA
ncbi:MAG: methionyl-tRNA formyltransferase [Porticoccaceae bacterium]|nr:methionyl-tRNA formyltransferase [Porticoccaceae bacterium]